MRSVVASAIDVTERSPSERAVCLVIMTTGALGRCGKANPGAVTVRVVSFLPASGAKRRPCLTLIATEYMHTE
jgi:hypothetical protein